MDNATVQKLLAGVPDIDMRSSLALLAKRDPVIWSMVYRRLRGFSLTYNAAKFLTAQSLAELQGSCNNDPEKYLRQVKMRLLRHRPFLIEPLRDEHPHKVYKKGRQTGVSELSVTEAVWFLASRDPSENAKWVYCVPDTAEILTRNGWRLWDEVVDGDETLVLDPVTHVSRWEPILGIETFRHDGPLRATGPFHCTDEHRWPVETDHWKGGSKREIVTADKIQGNHRLIRMAPHEHDGSESVLDPRLAAILGWVVTDGHQWMTGSTRGKNTVMMAVTQSEKSGKHLEAIEELLGAKRRNPHDAPGGTCWVVTVRREDINAILATGYRSKKDLPGIVSKLSLEAAEAMFQAMFAAEGCRSGRNLVSWFFAQNHGPVLDAFQMLCALTDRSANLNIRGAYVVPSGSRCARLKPTGWRSVKPLDYHGTVWCPRTPSGTWYMRYRGKVVFTGNTFPRLEQLQTFSDTRIKEIFSETKRLKELLTGTTAATRKRIGNGFLILRSAWDAGLGEGVDASAVTLDEKDRMKERIDIAFRESLESSPYGWLREVSTPSTPNRHIDASYQLSDQRQWFVACERCGEKQPIQWTESGRDSNIVQVKTVPIGCTELPEGAYAYMCRREICRGRLNRMAGEWVAKYPSKTKIRGYHIPQTIAPWQGATELMQKKINYKWLQLWLNYCMGETSVGETVLLHLSDFERISNDYPLVMERPEGFHDISVGIDWGHQNWVVVFGIGPAWDGTERPYLLNAARFDDVHNIELEGVKRIEQFIRPFDPDIIVADVGFGKDRNSYLLRRFGVGRFYACNYNPASRGSRAFQPVWSNPDTARLLIDRTMSLKDMCAAIREGDFGCPSLEHAIIRQWADHCLALTPHKEFDESPDGTENTAVVEVINKTGDDHLAHATNYALHGLAHLTKRGRFSFDFI